MDMAMDLTAKKQQPAFAKSRTEWGRSIRVLDVEMAGFTMPAEDRARVEVDYAWSRVDEGVLRTTRVAQDWRDQGTGFRLVREERVAGDLGLLGEPLPPATETKARPDVQFATKVIR
jgi:hypothetical protein